MIPLTKLRFHPLNPNEINETFYQKLKQNIARSKRYPALIVRPLGKNYQIIDGHIRFLILKELGYTRAKCEIWNVNNKEANLLVATLNRLRGTDDTAKRARLLGQLAQDFDDKELLLRLIPETERALENLTKILDNEFDLEAERGLIEEQLMQSGVNPDVAERIADSYRLPGEKPVLKFVFDNEKDYNKAIKYFGVKGDTSKLLALLKYVKRLS